jgi:uncharacterized protein YecA (UPF0149 family)
MSLSRKKITEILAKVVAISCPCGSGKKFKQCCLKGK